MATLDESFRILRHLIIQIEMTSSIFGEVVSTLEISNLDSDLARVEEHRTEVRDLAKELSSNACLPTELFIKLSEDFAQVDAALKSTIDLLKNGNGKISLRRKTCKGHLSECVVTLKDLLPKYSE